MELYTCSKCGFESTPNNFHRKTHCKKCHNKYNKKWAKENPIRNKQIRDRKRYKAGERPMSENKECPVFLGVFVAEKVLSKVFNDVIIQPYSNPGFDFLCNKGKKIDVKSSCTYHPVDKNPFWQFNIKKNVVADYFLCLAFDNRENLNPIHMWLIPGIDINHLKYASLSTTTYHKWDRYTLNIDKVSTYCDIMKGEHI